MPTVFAFVPFYSRYRLPPEVQRMATCELEADCLASDIIRQNDNAASGKIYEFNCDLAQCLVKLQMSKTLVSDLYGRTRLTEEKRYE